MTDIQEKLVDLDESHISGLRNAVETIIKRSQPHLLVTCDPRVDEFLLCHAVRKACTRCFLVNTIVHVAKEQGTEPLALLAEINKTMILGLTECEEKSKADV